MSKKNLKLLTILSLAALLSVCIVGAAMDDSEDSCAAGTVYELKTTSTSYATVGHSYTTGYSIATASSIGGAFNPTLYSYSVNWTCISASAYPTSNNSVTTLSGMTATGNVTSSGSNTIISLNLTGTPTVSGDWYMTTSVTYTKTSDSTTTTVMYGQHLEITAGITHTLSYNANGGSGAPSTQTVTDASSTTSMTVSSTVPTRTGYNFLGWATTSSATTAGYSADDTVSVGSTAVTLYAVWQLKTYTHIIYYDANGGSGAPSTQTVTNTISSYTMTISNTIPTYPGYTFLGWSKLNSATSPTYQPGGTTVVANNPIKLYAIWEQSTISVSGTPEDAALIGSSYSYTPTISVTECTLSIEGASWLTISNGIVTGTPTEAGTYEITITASQSGYTSGTQTFTVIVVSVLSFTSSPTGGVVAYAI